MLCWIWTAYIKPDGYGTFGYKYTMYRAHRFAYEWLVGKIPEGMVTDHYRMNPGPRNAPCSRACVNPEHLEIVSVKENTHRGRRMDQGTHCKQGHKYTRIYSYGRYCDVCTKTRTLKNGYRSKQK